MEGKNRSDRRRISLAQAPALSPDAEALTVPIDEGSFTRYYDIAMAASSMTGSQPALKDRIMPSVDETPGNVTDVVFGDNPLSRMKIAIKDQMTQENQMDKFPSVSIRLLALITLIGKGTLKRWARPRPCDPRHLYYPNAVIFAAASAPLNDDFSFKIDELERLVEELMGGTD